MKQLLFLMVLFVLMSLSFSVKTNHTSFFKEFVESENYKSLFKDCGLDSVMDFGILNDALIGYNNYDSTFFKPLLIVIDYSKPSTEKRFYVIDLENKKLMYHCFVAHGKGSGENIAKDFSNVPGSQKTCLGFFKTAETYVGKHGYSLKLDGLEKGINDKARERAIVIHGADYVSQEFIDTYGRLGRSWGCPALSNDLTKEIIDMIKDGACVYAHG